MNTVQEVSSSPHADTGMDRQKDRDIDSSVPALPLTSQHSADVVTGNRTKEVELAMPASGSHRTPTAHLLIRCGEADSVSKNTASSEKPLRKSPSSG